MNKKILYVYQGNPENINTQSGRPFSILELLKINKWDVDILRLDGLVLKLLQSFVKFLRVIKIYNGDTLRHPLVTKYFAIKICLVLKTNKYKYKYIFSPSTIPFADIDRSIKNKVIVVACVDTLLPGYIHYYKYNKANYKNDISIEAKSVNNCDYLFVPTIWAKEQLLEIGKKPAKGVLVWPFGANLTLKVTAEKFLDDLELRLNSKTIKIVSIMTDWERKRGDLLVKVGNRLMEFGLDCTIEIIGLDSHLKVESQNVKTIFHGRLDKNKNSDAKKYDEIMSCATYFCMPSGGEAFGMSLCEAAAYGLPLIGSKNGGISEIIIENYTGCYLNDDNDILAVSQWIINSWTSKGIYRAISLQARLDYINRLNWDSFYANTFKKISEEI